MAERALVYIVDFLLNRHYQKVIFALFSGALLVTLWVRYSNIFAYNADISGLESTSVIYFLQKFISGQAIYTDPEAHPFSIAQYTPLYYWLTGSIGKLIGTDPYEPIEVFRLSRIMSLVGNFIALGGIAFIALRHFNFRPLMVYGLVAIAFLFLEPQHFSRPDSWYLCFFIGAIAAVFEHLKAKTKRRQILYITAAAVFSVLAIFTKQSGIILPLLILSYLLVFRSAYKASVAYTLVFGLVLMLFVFSMPNTHVFLQNVVKGLDNGIDVLWFYKFIWSSFLPLLSPIIIFSVALAILNIGEKEKNEAHFLSYIVVGTFAYACVTAIKYGSGPNYFQEFEFFALLLCIVGLSRYNWLAAPAANRLSMLKLIGICTIFVLISFQSTRLVFDFKHIDDKSKYLAAKEVSTFINTLDVGPHQVFVNITGWVEKSFVNNFLFNKATMINKDIYGCCSYPRNVFNVAGFKTAMRNGDIKYIVVPDEWDRVMYLDETYNNFSTIFIASPYKVCILNVQ